MKILDLCEFYSERGGGVRSYLGKLSKAATARGHEFVVVAPGASDEEHSEGGARVIRFGAPRMPYDPTYRFPWRVDKMRELVLRERPDVLQVSSPFVPALVASTLRRVPVRAYVYHSDPIGCYLSPFAARSLPGGLRRVLAGIVLNPAWFWMRSVCNSCDITVVAGHWLENDLKLKGCTSVRTVSFGITHGDFGPERRDEKLRSQLLGDLASEPNARLVLIAGRLAFDKRQARLVEAVSEVSKERPLALVVLGDGPERARLEALASALPVSTFLPFTKDRAHYAAVLASVDVLLHGSLCETYGFVLAETLASGTPIVVPDAGGALALASPEASETYPALARAPEVATALRRLLGRPEAELRRAAVAAASLQPSLESHFDELFKLYQETLRKHRHADVGV